MKKLLLLFIGVLFVPMFVFAEEKEVVLDFSKIEDDLGNMTTLQIEALYYLGGNRYISESMDEENGKTYFVNQAGKKLIVFDMETKKYSIVEGVTSNDNFRVPIIREEDTTNLYSIVPQGVEILPKVGAQISPFLEGYDYIYVKFDAPMPVAEKKDTIDITLSNFDVSNVGDIPYSEIMAFLVASRDESLSYEYPSDDTVIIKNLDGKKLIKLYFPNGGSSLAGVQFEVLPGVTAEDNFEIELTDEDYDNYFDGIPGLRRYSRVIVHMVADPEPEEVKPAEPAIVNPYTFNNIYFVIAMLLGVGFIAGNQYFVKKLK